MDALPAVANSEKPATKNAATTLLYRSNIVSEDRMFITAEERRSILGLLNVAEAARRLGIPVRKMHWEITAGRLPAPKVRLGKRSYYTADDLPTLADRCSQRENRS
jgi:hypothetical protein